MKTMVVVPCMDMVHTEFCQSLRRMKTIGDTRFDFLSCSLIYKARTDLGLIAIKEKADFVLWLDSDMVFPSDLLVDLMKDIEGRDIVTGIYHMRRPPFRPVIYKTLKQGLTPAENETEYYDDYPKEELFKVDGCGFGAVLMRGSVLQAVVDRYHELFAPLPGYGEDLSFCVRARGCGVEIWADPKIRLGHKAGTIVTNDTFDAFRKANAIDD